MGEKQYWNHLECRWEPCPVDEAEVDIPRQSPREELVEPPVAAPEGAS